MPFNEVRNELRELDQDLQLCKLIVVEKTDITNKIYGAYVGRNETGIKLVMGVGEKEQDIPYDLITSLTIISPEMIVKFLNTIESICQHMERDPHNVLRSEYESFLRKILKVLLE